MFGLTVSVTVVTPVGSVTVEGLVDWVGSATPTWAVTATGRNHAIESGKSPKPLPMKAVGVSVENKVAPTLGDPVPPSAAVPPTVKMN
jgi:hypothetical protein